MELAVRLNDHGLITAATTPLTLVRVLTDGALPETTLPPAEDLHADDLPVGVRPNVLLGMVLRWSDLFDAARGMLEVEHRRVIERGAEHEIPGLLGHLSDPECWTGNLEAAARYTPTPGCRPLSWAPPGRRWHSRTTRGRWCTRAAGPWRTPAGTRRHREGEGHA